MKPGSSIPAINKTTIMRKYIVIALLCLFSTFSYGQTKEETISWLTEKLEKCLNGTYTGWEANDGYPNYLVGKHENVKLESINECEFIVTYHIYNIKFRTVFPTDIDSIKNTCEGSPLPTCFTFFYDAKVVKTENLTKKNEYYSHAGIGIIIEPREENIYARIEKAMKHLSTFCPKKKETF